MALLQGKAVNVVIEDVDVRTLATGPETNKLPHGVCNSSTSPSTTTNITAIIVINSIIANTTYWAYHILGTMLSNFTCTLLLLNPDLHMVDVIISSTL